MSQIRCTNAPATASFFVQLSLCRQSGWGGLPILDLLLPGSSRAARALSVRPYRFGSTKRTAGVPRSLLTLTTQSGRPSWRGSTSHQRTRSLVSFFRTFSTSPACRATYAIFNPQVDEDGNEMMLEITPRAAKRLSEIMSKDSNPNLALRIQVESGGCHGFQYLMKLVTLPPSLPAKESLPPAAEADGSTAIHEDDTIFTYVPDGNSSPGDLTAPKIILDLPSLQLLKGSKVDFTMELIGSQFKIVDNPLATSSCGCGTSFDIKI